MPRELRPAPGLSTLPAMAADPAGDALSRALDALVDRFRRLIEAVGVRHGVGREELDDLVQDVRIRLWRARQDATVLRELPSSYVYQAAVHAVMDRARARRAEQALAPLDALGGAEEPASPPAVLGRLDDEALHATVERALDTLGAPRRTVVRLHLVGYTRAESARLTGWTEAKVRNLLSRGLADLRAALAATDLPPWTTEDR